MQHARLQKQESLQSNTLLTKHEPVKHPGLHFQMTMNDLNRNVRFIEWKLIGYRTQWMGKMESINSRMQLYRHDNADLSFRLGVGVFNSYNSYPPIHSFFCSQVGRCLGFF